MRFRMQLHELRRWCVNMRIKRRDFTIISNNCWAGKVYQYLHLPYQTPTVGLYFFADDYLKFLSDLKYYLSLDLHFIPISTSKHAAELQKRGRIVPIGCLNDVEIVFLHYKSEDEAREKWNRRRTRINWDNLIVKISSMNLCTEEHLMQFESLPFEHKIMLHNRKKTIYKSEVYWAGQSNATGVLVDTNPFPGNLDLVALLK